MATRFRTWPEKVERLISIDCSSPMSASTRRRRAAPPRRPAGAGRLVQDGREPERLQRHGLAARVRAADDDRAQPSQVEVDRHRRRGIEQRVPCAEQAHLVADPHFARHASAREDAARHGQVELPGGFDERVSALRGRRHCGQLAQDPLDLLALGAGRLRQAVAELDDREGSTKSVWPDADASWTIPGTFERALALTASTGRPPRSVTNSSCRCSRSPERASRRSSSTARWWPRRSSRRSGAGWARPCRAGRSRRPRRSGRWPRRRRAGRDRSPCDVGEERRRRPRATRAPLGPRRRRRRSSPRRAARRRQRSAQGGSGDGVAHVDDSVELGLLRHLQERDRLRGQRLAAAHLRLVGRRLERERERLADRRGGGAGEPLGDRRELERGERLGVHTRPV